MAQVEGRTKYTLIILCSGLYSILELCGEALLPFLCLFSCIIGPSGRCAGGLAAANVVTTLFGIFFLLLFLLFLVPWLKPHKGIT